MRMFILKGKFEEIKAELDRLKEACITNGVQPTICNILKLKEGGAL